MIIFHEGLPRSGKSWEAMVFNLLPAVKAGRKVITNIEGIDLARIAEISKLPLPVIEMLVNCVYHDEERDVEKRIELQKASLIRDTEKDSLVIIDEIQNLFPSGRDKLSPEWMRYVTEHGHDGLDIILMGQDRRDCHNLWRRRINRVITFTKKTAVGMENHYKWEAHEATTPEKFKKISSGGRAYESKYFGMYSSHTNGTKNKGNYNDDRVNVFKTPGFKYGVPAFLVVLYFASSYIYGFFAPAEVVQKSTTPKVKTYSPPKPAPAASVPIPKQPAKPEAPPPIDVFDAMIANNRPRLTGVIFTKDKLIAQIDILNKSFHVQDSYTVVEIEDMGWTVSYRPSGLYVEKEGKKHIIRQWPIDKPGRVDRYTAARL